MKLTYEQFAKVYDVRTKLEARLSNEELIFLAESILENLKTDAIPRRTNAAHN